MTTKKYKVWSDSESDIDLPDNISQEYGDIENAYDAACELAHEHDGKPYWAIFHVEDSEADETVATLENFR